MTVTIRRATPADAASIVAVWKEIVGEKIYSAIDCPFSLEQEREYLQSLSVREGVFLAQTHPAAYGVWGTTSDAGGGWSVDCGI